MTCCVSARRAARGPGTATSCSVPCMMSPGCAPRAGSTKPAPPFGPEPSPLALLTTSVRPPSIERDHRRKPPGGNVAIDSVAVEIDHGDGVEPGAGDVEPPLVRAQRLAERQYAAQPFEPRHVQLDLPHDAPAVGVDDRDRVVRRVGDVDEAAAGDHRARAGAADGDEIVARRRRPDSRSSLVPSRGRQPGARRTPTSLPARWGRRDRECGGRPP